MTKSSVRSRRQKAFGRARGMNQATEVLHNDLVQVERQLSATQIRMAPDVPDVPRIVLKRGRVWSMIGALSGTINGSTTAEVDGAYAPHLDQFGDLSAFSALFDQYRFAQIRVVFVPNNTGTSSIIGNAPIYTVFDYDDASTTSIASLLDYDNLMTVPAGQYFERTFTPKFAVAAYAGAAFNAFGQSLPGQWVDLASSTVPWYGLKYGVPTSTNVAPSWYVTIQIVLQFRSKR